MSRLQSVEFYPCNRSACTNHYEAFSVLVKRANIYLDANPFLRLRSVESFILPQKLLLSRKTGVLYQAEEVTKTNETGKNFVCIRGLRLWLQTLPLVDNRHVVLLPDQFNYVNILPSRLKNRKKNLDKLGALINHTLAATRMSGKIVTVESIPVLYKGRETDMDKCCWLEGKLGSGLFVQGVRVYFVHGPQPFEMVAIEEFWPAVLRESNDERYYERYPEVLHKLKTYTSILPLECRVVNLQRTWKTGLAYRSSRSTNRQPLLRHYSSLFRQNKSFLQGIRLVYCIKDPEETMVKRPHGPFTLRCEQFTPIPLARNQFEKDEDVRNRVSAWISSHKVKVISVETVTSRVLVGRDFVTGRDDMAYSSTGKLLKKKDDDQRIVKLKTYRVLMDSAGVLTRSETTPVSRTVANPEPKQI